MRSVQQFIAFALLQILLWSSIGAEARPRKKPVNGGRIGVELDVGLFDVQTEQKYIAGAPAPGGRGPKANVPRIVFMAQWKVGGPLTDGQLVQIATDGYLDMVDNAKQYKGTFSHGNLPGVMTVFHWDDFIILASSQSKGIALAYTQVNNPILPLINACIQPAEKKSNEGKCGEMSAAMLYAHLFPDIPINSKSITTVTVRGHNTDTMTTTEEWIIEKGVLAPCNPDQGGGCSTIIGPGKVIRREVPVGTAPEPYDKNGWKLANLPDISFVTPENALKPAI